MSPSEVLAGFERIYLGDSLLRSFSIDIAASACLLRLSGGLVLKAEGASIFDPQVRHAPALLRLKEVLSVDFEGGPYQLNATVVDFGVALAAEDECVEFFFDLTGGSNPDHFIVRIKIVARGFEFEADES